MWFDEAVEGLKNIKPKMKKFLLEHSDSVNSELEKTILLWRYLRSFHIKNAIEDEDGFISELLEHLLQSFVENNYTHSMCASGCLIFELEVEDENILVFNISYDLGSKYLEGMPI